MRRRQARYESRLNAPRHDGSWTVAAESQQYSEFDRWITDELHKLVDRWCHFAAPSGARQSNDAIAARVAVNPKQKKS